MRSAGARRAVSLVAGLFAFFVASCAHVGSHAISEAAHFQALMRSTVRVDAPEGFGSGTVVWEKDGNFLVLTCAHVVSDGAGKYYVENPQIGKIVVNIEKLDSVHDLALLSGFSPKVKLHAIHLAAKDPELYSRVYLLGSPLAKYGALSEGFLASKEFDLNPEDPMEFKRWEVTGALCLFGISGGSALNEAGELVGVPEAVARVSPFQVESQMGFLVGLPDVKRFLKGYVI